MIATLDTTPETTVDTSSDLPQGFEDVAHICKMLADPSRLRIVFFLLHHSEMNVTDICGRLKQSQPAVSHHLGLLKRAGLVQVRRDGKHNFYSLRRDQFQGVILRLFDTIAETSSEGLRFDDVVLSWSPKSSTDLHSIHEPPASTTAELSPVLTSQ